MFEPLSQAMGAAKDRLVENAARVMINRKIEKFGSVTRFEIDSSAKTICLQAELKGEACPVSVKLLSYEITEQGGELFLSAPRIEASREWLQEVLNEYAAGRRFRLPEAARIAL